MALQALLALLDPQALQVLLVLLPQWLVLLVQRVHLVRQVLRPALRVQQDPLAQLVQQAQLALLELHLPLVALQDRLARLVMLAQQAQLVFQALPVVFTAQLALHH